MEYVVELDVADERLRRELVQDQLEVRHGVDERLELIDRLEALRREPGCGALEHPTQLDRVRHVPEGEGPDNEAAPRERLEQALVSEGR